MKSNTEIRNSDFRQFRTKIFFRTIALVIAAIVVLFASYHFVLSGHFANWVVYGLQILFRISYDAALSVYQSVIRNNFELVVLIALAVVFFVLFRIYLCWFTKYFAQINRGMDAITRENAEDIVLSPELLPIERKMNDVKQTIQRQKSELLESEQRKKDLIVYLAHDLKTPLASVIGYLNLLHDETEISEENREKYLSISLEKAERLEDLINEFFEVARFNLSNIALQCSRINLTRLLEQLVYEFKPMLDEKGLRCNLKAENDIMLKCDPNKLQRVFDNLLRNAVFYSFRDTEIDIAVNRLDDRLEIRFANHGDTIPPERLERIFEQFYRLDNARGSQSGGAGLGLAIAREIVELHGGTIAARSADEMVEFTVVLPAK